MSYSRYKFSPGDLVVTSAHHAEPGCQGILTERKIEYGTAFWEIHWTTKKPGARWAVPRECETNLFNLRRQYHFYNHQGEYYVSENR